MTKLQGWKAWAAGSVGFLFVSCCALGALVDKTKPNAPLVIDTAVPTKTATVKPSIVLTATPQATLEPTATASPEVLMPTATANAVETTVVPTAATEKSSVAQTGDSYPCTDGQIKANLESNKYHVPSGQFYAKTTNNVICFNSAQEAEAAGFVRSKR